MTWRILFHPLVLKEDFPQIDTSEQIKILKAIRRKLSFDPSAFGKPLTGELKGYWRLRVGEYRVIYRIERSRIEVYVIKIGMRRDFEVYGEMLKRLKRI